MACISVFVDMYLWAPAWENPHTLNLYIVFPKRNPQMVCRTVGSGLQLQRQHFIFDENWIYQDTSNLNLTHCQVKSKMYTENAVAFRGVRNFEYRQRWPHHKNAKHIPNVKFLRQYTALIKSLKCLSSSYSHCTILSITIPKCFMEVRLQHKWKRRNAALGMYRATIIIIS